MDKLQKTKLITLIAYNAIWLVLAIPFYFAGLSKFQETGGFGGWMLWGAGCSIFIISFIIKFIFNSSKDGARDGANHYTVSVSRNKVSVSNHPFGGAVLGAILGLLIGIAAGPIITPIFAIVHLCNLIMAIRVLVNAKNNT